MYDPIGLIQAPDLPATEQFPLVVSVKGSKPKAARKDGRFYVTRQQVRLGLWHSPSDVVVLS